MVFPVEKAKQNKALILKTIDEIIEILKKIK
jgi:hypothetical protein